MPAQLNLVSQTGLFLKTWEAGWGEVLVQKSACRLEIRSPAVSAAGWNVRRFIRVSTQTVCMLFMLQTW